MPKILVIEDEADQRNMLGDFFKGEGWEFFGAEESAVGIKTALEKRPDVILSDVNVPGMDGFEICGKLKADPRTANIPVVFISGNRKEAEDIVEGLGLGSATYLAKPVDLDVLKARLEAVIRLGK